MKKKLTDKQEEFCQQYIIDLNATQAAIRAKYSKDTARQIGQENLTKPDVVERIAELRAKRAKETGINQEYVVLNIQEVVERTMQKRDSDGKGRKLKDRFDPSSALKGLDSLAKHVGLYEKDNDQKKQAQVIADMSKLSEEEQNKILMGKLGL